MLASITGQLTTWIAAHGVVAVFALMALDALLPIGGELVMLYAGVIAAGVVHGSVTSLLGAHVHGSVEVYVTLALAGTAGSLAGSMLAWWLGRRAGRGVVLKHGHWLHVTPARLVRAERWLERHGVLALLVGRLTPLVRSFIAIPAGVGGVRLPTFVAVTLVPSLVWCFGFAAAGWALGGSWDDFHRSFEYVDYAVLAVGALLVAVVAARVTTARRAAARD
jgi:membrane protein DedA with SNARE-associated domain